MIKNPYAFEKRSIVLAGVRTSISLERLYWAVLERLAKKAKQDWRRFVAGVLFHQPTEYESRAGWLRFYVAGYAYSFLTNTTWHEAAKPLMEWDYHESVFRYRAGRPDYYARITAGD